MNGIEALDKILAQVKEPNSYEEHLELVKCTKQLQKDLKVLQILKDKEIDLRKLKINIDLDVDFLSKWFRTTLEEMQLIVEWLKEQPIAHFTRDVFREDQRSK